MKQHCKFVTTNQPNSDHDDEDYEEEENFLAEIADCVGKLGTWTLELYKNHDKILAD